MFSRYLTWRQLATHTLALLMGVTLTTAAYQGFDQISSSTPPHSPTVAAQSRRKSSEIRTISDFVTQGIVQATPAAIVDLFSPSSHSITPPADQAQLKVTSDSQFHLDPSTFVADAVAKVGPAVVRIDTERRILAYRRSPFFRDPFLSPFGVDPFFGPPQEFQQHGQGSGFIVDPDGTILTNAHVVEKADTVTISLRDGRQFEGEVKGVDPLTDLAVIQIQGRDLPVAALGQSSDLQVGDWAIAVGNPLGLDNTVTLGIISTLNRSSSQVGIPDKRLDFIQTDAAINPGNSGGPLINAEGEVIGINTAIRADAEGIGFAIPIDRAKAIMGTLARGEQVQHPYVGIRMLTLTPELARQYNQDPNAFISVPEKNGVLIVQVVPGSPADQAGLRRGDVIIEMAAEKVTTSDQLQDLVEENGVGNPLRVKIQRGYEVLDLIVRPSNMTEDRADS